LKLAFLDDNRIDYTPETPFERPLGGAESTAAYLTPALAARGHDVTLINQTSQPGVYRGVTLTGRDGARRDLLNSFDAVIVLTRLMGRQLRDAGVTAPLLLWQHKGANTREMAAAAEPAEHSLWASVVFVSDQQRQTFVKRFGLDGAVLRNAASPAVLATPVAADCFLDRGEDPTLIYASAPGHGLDMLLAAFASVRETLPGARLRICSDQSLYQVAKQDDRYSAVYALARALPGVEFVGAVGQRRLGCELAQADILAYPTNIMETSCIVAIEAAAASCLYVGNDYGPLRETLAGYGLFSPKVDSWAATAADVAKLVIDAVAQARSGPQAFKQRRLEQAAWFRATHTWEKRAEEWETHLTAVLGRAS
jgi:glycosyltransferase involved in cell wall biosynthesis